MTADLHIPTPRTTPDYEALHLDLVARVQALIEEWGAEKYHGLQLAAALRGEDS